MKKFTFSFTLSLIVFTTVRAQSYEDKKNTVKKVFDKIVEAYSNDKPEPKLDLVARKKNETVIALYTSEHSPTIRIDEKLVDICFTFKADSLNALAIIIAHELAHYYSGHTFCIDYAYAMDKKMPLKKQFIKYHMSNGNKMEKEYEADDQSLFFAAAAGYDPFKIFESVLDKIYKEYKLNDIIEGYPTKSDRKQTKVISQQKAYKIVTIFKAGRILTKIGEYEKAAVCFDEVKIFSSRENYNNAGVAKLLTALKLKNLGLQEFIYPIELDPISRLQDNSTRSQSNKNEKFEELIKKAEADFTNAIRRDGRYIMAYINLACLKDIQGNSEAAIGKLKDIPPADSVQYADMINLVKAIAYCHLQDTLRAAEYFSKLVPGKDSISDYNIGLYNLRRDFGGDAIEEFKNGWKQRNEQIKVQLTESQKKYLKNLKQKTDLCEQIQAEKNIMICTNSARTEINISIADKKLLRYVKDPDTNAFIIELLDNSWIKEHKQLKWMLIK